MTGMRRSADPAFPTKEEAIGSREERTWCPHCNEFHTITVFEYEPIPKPVRALGALRIWPTVRPGPGPILYDRHEQFYLPGEPRAPRHRPGGRVSG